MCWWLRTRPKTRWWSSFQFRGSYLTEGSASNVWIVKNGKLSALPKDNLILKGIRYGLMEELCADAGIEFWSRKITCYEVFRANEIMLTSAFKEILPVVTLDYKTIGTGSPGPIFATLYVEYRKAKCQ